MLGMMINPSMPGTPSPWKTWVDHITDKKTAFGFKKAALYRCDGAAAAVSSGFSISTKDIERLGDYFDINNNNNHESVQLQGKTYIIKSMTDNQMIAFNGKRYFIICKSMSMYIVVLCESRQQCENGAKWLNRLRNQLVEKRF